MKFLQGRALRFGSMVAQDDGVTTVVRKDAAEHLDGMECPVMVNHSVWLGRGRLRVLDDGIWFELPVDGEQERDLKTLIDRRTINGSSVNLRCTARNTKLTCGIEYLLAEKITNVLDVGPATNPRDILTVCRLSDTSIFAAAKPGITASAGKRPKRRIEVPAMPTAMLHSQQLMAAARAGKGVELRGRKLTAGQVAVMAESMLTPGAVAAIY